MIKRYMLDTNTVSYIIKGQSPAARSKLASLHGNDVACISVITEAELRFGVAKRPNAEKLRTALEGFLAKIHVLPWTREEAVAYGELRAKQEAAGKTLGNLDTLIAAHAIASGATLVTNDTNLANAADLPGSANWAQDLTASRGGA